MNKFQQFSDVVQARHSTRGFLSEPVSEMVLKEIFKLSGYAPSNCNTQPWIAHVVSGKTCQLLRQKIPEALQAGQFDMDFPYDGSYEGVYKDRQRDAAKQLYEAMNIQRDDKIARQNAFMQNFQFFNAPHVVFLFLPEGFGIREACDLGMYAQTLMLAMEAYDIGSCAQTSLSFHAGLVRETLSIESNLKLMFGISFGYEDPAVRANQARVQRAELNDYVTFHQ